jgi:hypothetical protein
MERRSRFLVALIVVAALGAGVAVIDDPAVAQVPPPIVFHHVFSDGDGGNKASYTIPDAYAFTQGSYVLMVSASVVSAGTPNVPTVTGKNLNWQLVGTSASGTMRVAVYQAWADNPQASPNVTFDFAGQTQLRSSRSFFEARSGVDRQAPVRRIVFSSGTGTTAQVALPGFTDPVANAAVLGVAKSNSSTITQELANEIADIGTGAEQHRLSAAWELGEETTPSASWSGSSNWIAVGLEISAGTGGPTPTTTTTVGPTTTTVGPTTTTLGDGGLDGWIGCSMTAQTFDGYRSLGGQQFYGGREYRVGGGDLLRWTSSNSRWWVEYRQQEALFGEPDRLVVMVCSSGGAAPTNPQMEAVLQIAEAEAPNAEIVVMRQPGYIAGHHCPLIAPTLAQQEAVFSAQQAVVSHAVALGATPGPVLPLLGPTTTRDGCNANAAGRALLGQTMVNWTGE